jgi:hypothetical protein
MRKKKITEPPLIDATTEQLEEVFHRWQSVDIEKRDKEIVDWMLQVIIELKKAYEAGNWKDVKRLIKVIRDSKSG